MKKPLETAWVGLESVWGRASENHQGGANSVGQVDGVSEMVPACQFCGSVGRALRKETMASATTSVWEKADAQLSP